MTSISRQQAFELLERRGVHEVRFHFSGGNDEGDVESIILRNAQEREIGQLDTDYYDREENGHLKWGPPEPRRLSMSDVPGPTLYKDGQQHRALVKATRGQTAGSSAPQACYTDRLIYLCRG